MDTEAIPFRISSGLKDIIGKELITDDDIAIFELVKNAYDAGAKSVKIIFDNVIKQDRYSKIIIIDDGKGMSKEDIVEKWLFVGFSEKKIKDEKDFRDKIKSKRIFAGAKGIGRFSSDRLGRFLNLYTKKSNEHFIHMLELDWKEFEKNQKDDFQTINTSYSQIVKLPKELNVKNDFRHGAILELSSLHNKWDREKLLKLKRYLQRLINPSSDQGNQDFSIEIIAPEFKQEDRKQKNDNDKINGIIKNFVFEKLGIKTTQISSEINDGFIITKLIDKGNLVVEFKEENPFRLLDGIKMNLFYLNTESKTLFTRIMGVQPVRYGSIFLYRNGFRVYSYGDEGNDWLELEKRKLQGFKRFLSARELMGRIEILGMQPGFQELSSRSEGLLRNQSYFQLIDYFKEKVLRRLERYVVEGIGWDQGVLSQEEYEENSTETVLKIIGKEGLKDFRFGKNFLEVLRDRKHRQIPEIIKNVETLKKYIKSKDERKHVEKQFSRLKTATKTLSKEREVYKQKYQITKKENLFLNKTLSSDTDAMINLVHSVSTASQTIEKELGKINDKIKVSSAIDDITEFVDQIGIANQKILRISKIITSAQFEVLSDSIHANLVQYITEYLNIGSDKDSHRIDIRMINEEIQHLIDFPPIEISLIFDNFLSNSGKADATLLTVLFEKEGKKLRILVGDNGHGVSDIAKENLFTRSYSTTKSGTGLGLYYNKKMIESIKGTLKFLGNDFPEMGRGACFEVVL